MQRRWLVWMIAAACLLIFFFSPQLRSRSSRRGDSLADSVFSGLVKSDEPGCAVVVRQAGTNIYERTYGVRDLRSKAPLDAQTNFRLASFTKQFTAMATMLLVHDGKLRYDETLTEIFQDFPAYGKNIAVYHLLNHTSGLPDYEDLMEAPEKSGSLPWTPDRQIQDAEVVALLKKETHGKFAPGTAWAYSNSGYVVLGEIVAKVSGKSYGDFLHDRIFTPLKMNSTIVYQRGKNEVTNRAYGHSKEGDTLRETDQSSTSATLGDGGVYSNLADLASWDDALRNHTLLPENEMRAALIPQPQRPAEPGEFNVLPGRPVAYGFGWFLDAYRDSEGRKHRRMWHTGSTMGFRTVIERFTEGGGLTVIMLCNRTDLDPEKLALKIASDYPPLK